MVFCKLNIFINKIQKFKRKLKNFKHILLDQGAFSAAGFLIVIILANILNVDGFSLFSTLISISVLIFALHNSSVVEPFLVGINSKDKIKNYEQTNLTITLLLSGATGFFVFWYFKDFILSIAFVLYLYTSCSMLFYRRVLHLAEKKGDASKGSIAYLIVVLIAMGIFGRIYIMNAANAFFLISAIQLFAITLYLRGLKKVRPNNVINMEFKLFAKKIIKTVPRWNVMSAVFAWPATNISYILIPILSSAQEAASLRVILTLTIPLMQFISVLGIYFLPKLAEEFRGEQALNYEMYLKITIISTIFYCLILLMLWRLNVFNIIWGGKIEIDWPMLAAVTFYSLVFNLYTVYASLVKASGFGSSLMYASLIGGAISISTSYFFIIEWGVEGALGAMTLSVGGMLTVVFYKGRKC